ncbi:MAG: hypothetical protein F6K00_17745 [Leptolyngbya sp. SIOISBB]|nr:hypothetical protein [Leptolyngbya sp. SIOISBB]
MDSPLVISTASLCREVHYQPSDGRGTGLERGDRECRRSFRQYHRRSWLINGDRCSGSSARRP